MGILRQKIGQTLTRAAAALLVAGCVFIGCTSAPVDIQSTAEGCMGEVSQRIRAYYNPLSICQPPKIRPGRTHGDAAEFYDAGGRFMGLAVYMGQGQYFLLYYSGYQNAKQGLQ